MKKVWKFTIPNGAKFTVEMPTGARVLTAQVQDGVPVVWALIDTAMVPCTRTFLTVWSGENVNSYEREPVYISTFTVNTSVYHLFELQ